MIQEWIDRLSKRSEFFSGLSACPYARNAQLNVVEVDDARQAHHKVAELKSNWSGNVAAIIVKQSTLEELYYVATFGSDEEWLILEDHPDQPEFVGDVQLNHGELKVLLMQPRSEIEGARKVLHSKGYYDNYSAEDYEDLMRR